MGSEAEDEEPELLAKSFTGNIGTEFIRSFDVTRIRIAAEKYSDPCSRDTEKVGNSHFAWPLFWTMPHRCRTERAGNRQIRAFQTT